MYSFIAHLSDSFTEVDSTFQEKWITEQSMKMDSEENPKFTFLRSVMPWNNQACSMSKVNEEETGSNE